MFYVDLCFGNGKQSGDYWWFDTVQLLITSLIYSEDQLGENGTLSYTEYVSHRYRAALYTILIDWRWSYSWEQ